MDPKSFTQTSFCNVMVDNITENTSKKYILEQLEILCSGKKYSDRYAKVYNDRYSKNLNNPHLICLKSIGNPYFLFITQINSLNYAFLIDRKIKEGYQYPKIFILPYHFIGETYKNHSLFECELIRNKDNRWILSIIDVYYMDGVNMKNTIVIDRMNKNHRFFENCLLDGDFNNICRIQIKKYFNYNEINHVMDDFIPKLSYSVRGLYLVPLRKEYSKILYLFPKQQKNKKDYLVFRLLKTLKPDVYELYLKKDDSIHKKGIALVQNIKMSHLLSQSFQEEKEVYMKCRMNEHFNKWEPFEKTTEQISTINDL